MKTKIVKTLALIAGLVAGSHAYAAGNIYEIVPCSEDGKVVESPVATLESPLVAGETLYFKLRMPRTMAMKTAGEKWRLEYIGSGSLSVDAALSPLKLGIFVSGELTYATYTGYVDSGEDVREFIFSYTTRRGDFALPIRLAGNDGNPVGYGDSSSEYMLLNADKWAVVSTNSGNATFQFGNSEFSVSSAYPSGRQLDYSLAMAGFYVKTIDFDSEWESDDYWRIVNSGATTTQSLTPKLVAASAPSNAVSLYVWSMNDDIVSINGGTDVEMVVGYNSGTPVKQTAKVGTITFAAGQVQANFTLKGGDATHVGQYTNLVLSAFQGYSYNKSFVREVDYVTVPVQCTDPLPPTVKATMDISIGSGNTVYASSDYLKPVATLTVSLSETPASAFTVALQPSFSGDVLAETNWWDYVYIAESTELNDVGELSEFSEGSKKKTAPTIEFTPTDTTHTFYVFALRADSRTNRAGHQMKFTPTWSSHPYASLTPNPVSCYIQAVDPVATIEKGADESKPAVVIRDDPFYLKISVEDTFADITSTNGYELTVSLDASGSLADPDPITNLVAGANGILYVANADGTPSSTLPSVRYGMSSASSSPNYFSSRFTVTSPESGLTSAAVPFYVQVKDKTSYILTLTDEETGEVYNANTPTFEEGDEITFTVTLDSQNTLGQTIYAYVAFKTDFDESKVFETDGEQFIVGMSDVVEGLPIGSYETVAEGTVRCIDNATTKRLEIDKIYFSYESQLDSTNLTNLISYDFNKGASVSRINVLNIAPELSKIKLGTTSLDPETIYATKLPLDAERRFTAVVSDIDADLNATNGTERFQTMWSTYCYMVGDGESVDDYADDVIPGLQFEQMDIGGEGTILYGNPNKISFTNSFTIAGIWKISCQIKDKDTDEFSEAYNLYLKVTDAGVSVTEFTSMYEEDRSQQLTVSLNYYDSMFAGTVYVALKVKSNAADATNPGRLKFNQSLLWTNVWTTVQPFELSDSGTVTNAADSAADYYLLSFSSRNNLSQKLSILDADGVNDTFTYCAYVVSAQRNGVEVVLPASGKLAAEYYAPSAVEQVTVFNTDPNRSYIRVSPNPDVNTNVWNSAKAINWTVPYNADVIGDFESGVVVTFSGDGLINGFSTNITGTTSGSFLPDLGGASGMGEIVFTVTDKDGGFQEYVWHYNLPATKTMVTIPNGPTGIGNSDLSQKYVAAPGRGRGHLYPQGASISSVSGFTMTWFCSGLSEVPVFGFGYRSGDIDNGWLNDSRDQAITESGAKALKASSPSSSSGYYNYTSSYDSYLYAWIISEVANESGSATWQLTLAPEVPSAAAAPAYAALPTETAQDGTFIPTKVEAVFSREFLESDNLGDINQDGVPDIFVSTFKLGTTTSSEGETTSADDLESLAADNSDGDLLPGIFSQDEHYMNAYDGAKASYAPIGVPLTTPLEIRGFHEGLNETEYTTSDVYMSEEEYAARTNWYVSVTNGTATYWGSVASFVAAYPTPDDVPLSVWSPEPRYGALRMDPTMDDTDGDGFPDGWEYFFWYQAHVWKRAYDGGCTNVVKGCPRNGQTYLFERYRLDSPIRGDEITSEEVEARFHPAVKLDAAVLAELPDFDGDGLSDLEELLIGTNPCHWDTDGDHLCDSWEVMMCLDPLNTSVATNDDGDFMACYVTSADYVLLDTTGGANATDDANWYANGAHLAIIPDLSGTYVTKVTNDLYRLNMDISAEVITFSPKWDDDTGAPLAYGSATGIKPEVASEHYWGYSMVDDIQRGVVTNLTAGSYVRLNLEYIFIHDQVRDAFDFDPRTAWGRTKGGYVTDRWDPGKNSDIKGGDETGLAVNTRAYTSYDEYLVMLYRMKYGIIYSPEAELPEPEDTFGYIRAKTTNPSLAYPETASTETETDSSSTNETTTVSSGKTIAAEIAEVVQRALSSKTIITTHGADTDLDGVPDGWELYMYRCPNAAYVETEEYNAADKKMGDFDGDGLNFPAEFAGVDSCNAYKGCESIYSLHPGINGGWWNKFFPTNPGTMTDENRGKGNSDGKDTDADGISDGAEGSSWGGIFYNAGLHWGEASMTFIYGAPSDNGKTVCFRGGGMNPCTIDTDQDGLPDPWEKENAGVKASAIGRCCLVKGVVLSEGTFIADGIFTATGAADPTNGVYIAGGMDATWSGDTCTSTTSSDSLLKAYSGNDGMRDVDFDHDGLQNYQEYMVQTMRHFRYDDTTTPLMGRILVEGSNENSHTQKFVGYIAHDAADPDTLLYDALSVWTNRLTAAEINEYAQSSGFVKKAWDYDGWRELGYFAPPKRKWDRSYFSKSVGSFPLYLLPPSGASAYVSTDPRMPDTDLDGMDDYWELFHGLNPILGSSVDAPELSTLGTATASKQGDIISAAYGYQMIFNGYLNEWIFPAYNGKLAREGKFDLTLPVSIKAPQCYDPILYPWLMGSPLADADGDGLRNDEERLLANVADPMPRHTDPTPLWFTDRTSPSSYVSQYYHTPIRAYAMIKGRPTVAEGYSLASVGGSTGLTYLYGFEENEGYDTDNDWVFDGREVVKTATDATDPLVFADPDRRQALWLNGTDAFAMSFLPQGRVIDASDLLKQFTVECWVKPEKTGADQTIVDRSCVLAGASITSDASAIRANFRIGLTAAGTVYGLFDNSDSKESGLDNPTSCQRVNGPKLDLDKWTHVALSFDGATLSIYVNGDEYSHAATTLIPANGVQEIVQPMSSDEIFGGLYRSTSSSLFVGARPVSTANGGASAFDVTEIQKNQHMREFFKGYVDEIRVWDGARTATQIKENYLVRMSFADAAANREEVYAVWKEDGTRNSNDSHDTLPPELVMHYNFQTLPGAVNAGDVAKTPAGFSSKVVAAAQSDYVSNEQIDTTGLYVESDMSLKGAAAGAAEGGLLVGWWNACDTHSTVYDDYHVVPWIQNTVGHLPMLDGSMLDSMLYHKYLGGGYTPASTNGIANYVFPNTGNPYPYIVYDLDRLWRLNTSELCVLGLGMGFYDVYKRYCYQVSHEFVYGSDLIPMGGAFAKTCSVMWDGHAADAWEYTGSDADGDGLPDWWVEYIRNNSSYGVDPSATIRWDTLIGYNGKTNIAGRLYLMELAKGLQPDGTINSDYASTADDNGNGIADWWEKMYGIYGCNGNDDLDGDGLSNYVEYLLSEVLKLGDFAPDDPFSVNKNVSDYFFKIGELYAGQIFTDHDQVNDIWEAEYLSTSDSVSPYLYDANLDPDDDGWSNYAEFQAGTDPTKLASLTVDAVEMDEYPVPTIELTVSYAGTQATAGKPLVVKAWSDRTLQSNPDAIWTLGSIASEEDGSSGADTTTNGVAGIKYFGMNPMREMLVHLSPGSVVPGSVKFEFKDLAWVLYDVSSGQSYIHDSSSAIWNGTIIDKPRTDDLSTGDIVYQGDTTKSLGTINYATGEMTVDFAAVPEYLIVAGDITGQASGGNWLSIYDLHSSYVRVTWSSKLVTGGRSATYYLSKADAPSGEAGSLGHVKEGLNTFIAFYDINGDGMYTPGEPFGTVRDVNVGWNYGKLSVALTGTTPVTVRYKLTSDTTGEGSSSSSESSAAVAVTDREALYPEGSTDVFTVPTASAKVDPMHNVHVRIVRYAVDSWDNGKFPAAYAAVVYDRNLDLTPKAHPSITEADIFSMACNDFDLDWNAKAHDPSYMNLSEIYAKLDGTTLGDRTTLVAFTNVYYAVFVGQDPIVAEAVTNENMLSKVIMRKFAVNREPAQAVNGSGVVNSASPTFRWRMPDTTYTAFRVRVSNSDGFSWTSDFQFIPAVDGNGVYSWTAPICAGAIVPGGTQVFSNATSYTWEISTYNAKFATDNFVKGGDFYLNVPESSQDYGTARVAVRYYGPSAVAATNVPIRVQAFTTPDFAGAPVAEGYVTNYVDIASTNATESANAVLLGLKAGTYYIRAFIDTDLNGKLSRDARSNNAIWESWGYYCGRDRTAGGIFVPKRVTVDTKVGVSETIPVFIEDCDIDQDCLPDAWEWSVNGNLETYGASQIDQQVVGFAMNKSLTGAMAAVASPSSGLAVRSLSATRLAALSLGVCATGTDEEVAEALRSAPESVTAEPTYVKITALNFDLSSGTVSVTAETEGSLTGGTTASLLNVYEFDSDQSTITLTLKLWHRASLDAESWTEVGSRSVQLEKTTKTYTYEMADELDLASGFFKVTLE